MSEQSTELVVRVSNEQLLKAITFNFDELKAGLNNKLEKYKSIKVTKENMAESKQDMANLNKLEKAIADKVSEINEISVGDLNRKSKELRTIILDVRSILDVQAKALEAVEDAKKKAEIKAIYLENICELEKLMPFEKVFKPEMLNKGSKLPKITEEIKLKIDTVKKDLTVIDTLQVAPEIQTSVKDYYLRTLDLSGALSEKSRLEQVKANLQAIAQRPKQEVVEPVRPIIQPQVEVKQEIPMLKATFTVIGTREQLSSVREFLINNKIQYEGVK